MSLTSMPPHLWLGIAIVSTAITAIVVIFWFAPTELVDPVLRGYRATRRRAALEESALLRLIWPLVRLGTYYATLLPAPQWKEDKSLALRNAGEPVGFSPEEFIGFNIACVVIALALSLLFQTMAHLGTGLIIVGLFLGALLPNLWLGDRATNRLLSINRGLPQALDLIVLSMGAGLDFVNALRHVVEKWSDKRDPLCEELSRFLHELNLGKTRKEALQDLAHRAPTELVKAFVTNVLQAEQRGTPLVDVLRIQAEVARTRRFQTAEKVAGRAGVVILLPLMFIFAATVLVMFGGLIVKGFRGELF